jgi:hypothetical protein
MPGSEIADGLVFLYVRMPNMRLGRAGRCLSAAIGATLALLSAPAAPAFSADGVLVVGDSLEVGTSPYLRGLLRGIPLEIDARTSRPSSDGVGIVRDRLEPGQAVVVFDLGTNDDPAQPAALAADLTAVRSIVGDRCLVVATLNRPPYNGVSIDGLNRVVRDFAHSSPPVQLVDWRGAVLASPSLVGQDGVHATPAGYMARAQLIAQGIAGCLPLAAGVAPGTADSSGTEAESPPAPTPPPGVDWAALGVPRPGVVLAAVQFRAALLVASLGRLINASVEALRSA